MPFLLGDEGVMVMGEGWMGKGLVFWFYVIIYRQGHNLYEPL